MKVELSLHFGNSEYCSTLFERGYLETAAYKNAELPTVFHGMELWIPFVHASGKKDSLTFIIGGVAYDLDSEVFSVYIQLNEASEQLLIEMITEENGWRNYTSLGNKKFNPVPE